MAEAEQPNAIFVLAGVNGAGKSTVLAETFLERGITVFNPDAATDLILRRNPTLSRDEANENAWEQGRRLLETAIEQRLDYAFETTLGGTTITRLLERALRYGQHVFMAYVGLQGAELHIDRVRRRVAAGGHDVPEVRIRLRYDTSRLNLVRLLPRLTELRLYDNSHEADPASGKAPHPVLILHAQQGRVRTMIGLESVPQWAKPLVAAAASAGHH